MIHYDRVPRKAAGSYREFSTRNDVHTTMMFAIRMMISQQFNGCIGGIGVFAYSTDMFMNAEPV
uniref:Uncharacterized protein n=1 Tax=Parascaris equorum TaxID=6256 RepID=A0A914RSE7_PAREQ